MINQCELVMGKIIACKTTELESGNLKKITVDGKEIVMANVDGNYFACDDTCTHSGASYRKEQLITLQSLVDGMELNLIVQLEVLQSFQQR